MRDIRSEYTDSVNFFGATTPRALADTYGTPLYVYNAPILRQRCRQMKNLTGHPAFAVDYSVKANSNPELLKIIRAEGLLVDAMSPGELAMDLLAGYEAEQIFYISNNNTPAEMLNALTHGCLISIDSISQLEMLAGLRPGGRVMIRVNPGIGQGHHAKVVTGGAHSKFGVNPEDLDQALEIVDQKEMDLVGLNQHIGSLFMRPESYLDASRVLLAIAEKLPPDTFSKLEYLDFGGGFGIPYRKYAHEERLNLEQLGNGLKTIATDWIAKTGYTGRFLIEPGRYVVAECGVLLGRVTSVKNNGHTRFVGTDIGFNVLQRPVMYGSFHDLEIYGDDSGDLEKITQTVVGNICESGDILARDRLLPPMKVGDLIGVLDVGAYGFSMASNYNQRYLPAEVLIEESGADRLIRRRQTAKDLEACLLGRE